MHLSVACAGQAVARCLGRVSDILFIIIAEMLQKQVKAAESDASARFVRDLKPSLLFHAMCLLLLPGKLRTKKNARQRKPQPSKQLLTV
jgi:hypothetical protein